MTKRARGSPFRNLIVAAFALAFPAVGNADLIDDHIKAVGGEEAIANLKTFKRTGTIRVGGLIGNFAGSHVRAAIVRSKAYTKSDLGISIDEEGWNGTVGWKRDAQEGLRKIYGTDLYTIRGVAEVDGIVQIYRQFGRAAFSRGPDASFGGKTYHVISVVGMPLTFYLDPRTKMISGSRLTIPDPNTGGEVAIVSSHSDYADFGGVKMPNHINVDIAGGTITIDIKFEKTEIGIALPDSLFEVPAR